MDLDAGLDGTPMDSSEVEFQTSSSPSPSALEGRCVEADSMTDEDILRQATKSTAATGTQVPSSVFEGRPSSDTHFSKALASLRQKRLSAARHLREQGNDGEEV